MRHIFIWGFGLVMVSLFFVSCSGSPRTQDSQVKVAASIFPVYDIARNVAGDTVGVVLILPPGASPHTFSPDPSLIQQLSGSQAIFMIGHGIDSWVNNVAQAAEIQETIVVDRHVNLIPSVEDNHSEAAFDPHYWLSVTEARHIALQIKEDLQRMFPAESSQIEENYSEYDLKLARLEKEVSTHIQKIGNPTIATFHNAWSYFARDHGLNIVATFEEFPGEEPSAQYIARFQKEILSHNVKVIFAEPQFSTVALKPVAADAGVVIGVLNPIEGGEESGSYIEYMQENIVQIDRYAQ